MADVSHRGRRAGGLFWRTFFLIGTLIVASLLSWSLFFRVLERTPRAQQIAWQISSIVNLTRAALVNAQPERRQELLAALARDERLRVGVLEPTDRIDPHASSGLPHEVGERLRVLLGPSTITAAAVNGTRGFWVSFDIDGDGYWLVFDRGRVERNIGRSWISWALVAIGLSLAGALVTSRVVNRPLADLAGALRELARGARPRPLPETGPREIAELNGQFNRMADALAALEADRALALAGISHDVRTPLTRLRMEIELADLPDTVRAAMVDDIEAIDRIVAQFIEFARGGTVEAADRVPVAELLVAMRARHDAELASGAMSWELDVQANAWWIGRMSDFERIASNLIENARRYGATPGAGRVEMRTALRRSDAGVVLTVEDRGVGVPAAELERLVRPFARLDSARGAPGASGGSGLGLAIVERLAARYGGRLQLKPSPTGGLSAQVQLPDAETAATG